MTPTEVEQFIRDGQARGLTQEVVGAALFAHVMAEPPAEREHTLTGIGLIMASRKSQRAGKGLMDAGILADVLGQLHGGDVEVRTQEFRVPASVIPGVTLPTCPVCDATFLAALMSAPSPPQRDDLGICTKCGAALTFTEGGLRLATAQDLHRMDSKNRGEFLAALTATREQLSRQGVSPATGPF